MLKTGEETIQKKPHQKSQEEEKEEEVPEEAKQKEDPTNWTVTPYDLGGHTSYFNSQKLFTSGSSVFFLAFQR